MPLRLVFVLVILIISRIATAQSDPAKSAQPPLPAAPAASSWAGSLETYGYLMEDDDFVVAVARADRGRLHLEGRYQYEDLRTISAWAGWSFEAGTLLHLEVVPMAGVLAGQTVGFAPGLEATVSWKSLEWYSEIEYVLDVESTEGDYFYVWSQLGWQAKPWLALGLSGQRTRLYQSEFSIDRGIFAATSVGPVALTAYGFNLDGEAPFAILALGIDF